MTNELREIGPGETGLAFEAMKALRSHHGERDEFVRRVDEVQRPQGYRLVGAFEDGDDAVAVAGFRVIATPGHSRGHTCLLRDEDGLLFTADAFGCLPRKIRVGVRKALCMDPAQAKRSAQKLLAEEFTTVVFSHGKPLREGAKEHLRRVVAECRYE